MNVGFTPEGKYLTAGNDVVDLSKWGGTKSVNIGDAFSNDNDKVTVMAKDLATGANNLKLTSIENLEIINANEKQALNLVGENFKGLESIELKGDATTLNVSDFTYGVKIDATENADNIFGGFKADTINGGAGNDTIQGNQGDDVLTGGNGADTFIVGNAKDFGVDQILDFSAEDKISMDGFSVKELKKFDASTFSTVTYKTLDSVLATFAAGGANVTKAGDVAIFSYDGKTYALLSTGVGFKEANDALVDITGANVASLTESNFGEFISQYNYASVAAFNEAAKDKLIPVNTATITVGSGDVALESTYIDYIKDGGISGATVSIKLQDGTGETFDANDYVAKFASKTPALNIIGGTGNDVITAPLFGGTINGGSGNDTINASAAIGAVTIDGGAGADSIIGGAGNDSITGGEGKDTITGGSGNDTIVLTETTSASDTIIFAANAADNGKDTITGFVEAGNGKDVLKVSEFLGASISYVAADASSSAATVDSGKNVVAVKGDKGIKFNAADVGKQVVVIQQNGTTVANADVFYYTVKSADTATEVKTFTDQVATLVGVDDAFTNLKGDNFA